MVLRKDRGRRQTDGPLLFCERGDHVAAVVKSFDSKKQEFYIAVYDDSGDMQVNIACNTNTEAEELFALYVCNAISVQGDGRGV